jgi:hypothetical protein
MHAPRAERAELWQHQNRRPRSTVIVVAVSVLAIGALAYVVSTRWRGKGDGAGTGIFVVPEKRFASSRPLSRSRVPFLGPKVKG